MKLTELHVSVAKTSPDGISKGDVSINSGKEGYKQIKLIGGLDNAYHTLKLTIISGTITIDTFIMGSPTEIPAPKSKVPEDYYTRASYNRPWIMETGLFML